MAITKILARKGRLDIGIRYVLDGDKTEERVLTACLNCDPGRECSQMLDTKRSYGKEDGVQYYHMIQSFRPGEITPKLALEIAKEFAEEHFAFLRDNAIVTWKDMTAFTARTEETLVTLMKQRTILNVRKKKRRSLYAALADAEALAPARALYEEGLSGMEAEFAQYMEAVAVLAKCGFPKDRLMEEKA